MWFTTRAVGLSFTDSSPFRIANEIEIAATPERVFDVFANAERQETWFQDFVATRWTSGEPRGVGSEREVELKMLTVKERFLAWDRGKRMTFCIYAITLPLVHAMVEDLRFEPTSSGGTRFVWHVYYDPTLLFQLVHPIGRAVFSRMFRASQRGLKTYVEARPTPPS